MIHTAIKARDMSSKILASVLTATLAALLAAGCTYNDRPPPGAVTCAEGAKACPDDYHCYRGSAGVSCAATCWPNGQDPGSTTDCKGATA